VEIKPETKGVSHKHQDESVTNEVEPRIPKTESSLLMNLRGGAKKDEEGDFIFMEAKRRLRRRIPIGVYLRCDHNHHKPHRKCQGVRRSRKETNGVYYAKNGENHLQLLSGLTEVLGKPASGMWKTGKTTSKPDGAGKTDSRKRPGNRSLNIFPETEPQYQDRLGKRKKA